MIRPAARRRISPHDLAQDRDFWAAVLERNRQANALPPHTGGGYRNRRFAIIRDAAWITLYRAVTPSPQIGVFLRCTGPAGDAFFTLADRSRRRLEPKLRAALGADENVEWGTSHHPGMTDIAAIIAAPLPWDDAAAEWHVASMLRIGQVWWAAFDALAR